MSQFYGAPTKAHKVAVDRIFRYLWYTKSLALTFNTNATDYALIGYSDANWGRDYCDRKLVLGYVFILVGAVVSWQSKR